MEISTRYFGTMLCSEDESLIFEKGLYGYENEKKFIFINFEDDNMDILCMQSLMSPDIAFVVMNPFALMHEYNPEIKKSDLEYLGVESDIDLNFYVVCLIREVMPESTANFRSPIVINPKTNKGLQIVLEDDKYLFKHRFEDLAAVAKDRLKGEK